MRADVAVMVVCILSFPTACTWVRSRTTDGRTYRWTLPKDSRHDTGLGGGISWALAPSEAEYCASLLPSFHEGQDGLGIYSFVDCDELIDGLERAFRAWSANHRQLHFERCIVSADGGADGGCTPEVLVRATPPDVTIPERETFAAYVHARGTHGNDRWRFGPRDTAGTVHADELIIGVAELVFHTHVCWYLDATFCSIFQSTEPPWGPALDVIIVLLCALGCAFTFALAAASYFVVIVIKAACKQGTMAALSELSKLGGRSSVFVVFWLLCPPILYARVYVPCIECYDFTSAAAHEIGHVLGFEHPDQFPQRNLRTVSVDLSYEPRDTCSQSSRGGGGEADDSFTPEGLNASYVAATDDEGGGGDGGGGGNDLAEDGLSFAGVATFDEEGNAQGTPATRRPGSWGARAQPPPAPPTHPHTLPAHRRRDPGHAHEVAHADSRAHLPVHGRPRRPLRRLSAGAAHLPARRQRL